MNQTILHFDSQHIYYDIEGVCFFIKNINTLSEYEANVIVNDYHEEHGKFLDSDSCPVDCPAEIAHKYLS